MRLRDVVPVELATSATSQKLPALWAERPRVLAYCFEDASEEAQALEQEHLKGTVNLTLAPTLGDLWQELSSGTFDVLSIACHGSGKGLDYRLSDEDRNDHVLYVHDLLSVTVPPTVFVASCYSGNDGTDDTTGLLATLLARGAREVLSSTWALPNDSTVMIMTKLYERLNQPGPTAEKLALCQREMVASNPHLGGVYWWGGLAVTTR